MDEDNELYQVPGPSRGRRHLRARGAGRGHQNQNHTQNTNRSRSATNWRANLPPGPANVPGNIRGANRRAQFPVRNNPYRQQAGRSTDRSGYRTQYNDNRNTNENFNSPRTNSNDQQKPKITKRMNFKTLEALVASDVKDILTNFNEKKEAIFNILESPIERPDEFVLIMKLLSKTCQSSFDQIKSSLLLDTCKSQFILNLRNYLMDLHYCDNKAHNKRYWDNQTEFWRDFIVFCECIVTLSPSTALSKCRSLIDDTSKCCLDGLRLKHDFVLPEDEQLKLIKLREKLEVVEVEKKSKDEKVKRKFFNIDEENEPPENFRELSIVPTREDLLANSAHYLRANVVKGNYRDVEHYLDVQFRLLREDCLGPLRDGIRQYILDPTQKKYDNIRVFRDVKFIEPYVSPQKIGSIIALDEKTKKRQKNINWSHSKLLNYGSLVLLTKDNCATFIVATIIDRDEKFLKKGLIPISVVDSDINGELNKNDIYTMIESEVYFEPYYYVLKALRDPTFPQHIAMKKYIIDVKPDPSFPAYVNESSTYKVKVDTNVLQNTFKFNVANPGTWPSSEDLKLNESQYEAYKTCLTHEFAVIQGPPGTGKTFLGVKVAKTLLMNLARNGCLLLLVCYTNHALDQFLEAISKLTDSIVRIGGRSKNEALDEFNLTNLRKSSQAPRATYKLFFNQRQDLKAKVTKLQKAQGQIDAALNNIVSYQSVRQHIPLVEALARSYKAIFENGKDPLCYWLFEHIEYDLNETYRFVLSQGRQNKRPVKDQNVDIDINVERQEVIFDDLEIDLDEYESEYVQLSFSLKEAEKKMIYAIGHFMNSSNELEKGDLLVEIAITRARIELFNQMQEQYIQEPIEFPGNIMDEPTRLNVFQRWMLYFSWTKVIVKDLKDDIIPLQESLANANAAYEEARMIMDIELIQNKKVVGMTTSGAARLRKLLQALAPPIVIVEEAAEVLEQHIVTSLTRHCQHLILIGDHQQLRPSAAYMRLARDYNIDVSLFERMILNEVHSRRLNVQHRMRPEIAALVCPHIYPDLANHPSVSNFPDVRGLTHNLFFFTHTHPEERVDDSASKSNYWEANITLGLANYIMQQGYDPEDVTILTLYSGQMFYMRQQRGNYAFLHKVKITVVDNYQGEESKIILLSLVRNNEKTIGFLGTANRICVALSRAREGFYIFGNIDLLKDKSDLWKNIAVTLEDKGSVGSSIRLKCENHDTITTVSSETDFQKVPEGGCTLKCNYDLACGHKCPLICHGYDRGHTATQCNMTCERIICELNHVCPLMCREPCAPCMVSVEKKLPCGHTKKIHCHLDPTSPGVKCLTLVPVKLPLCGHDIKKPCYLDMDKARCPVPCEFRVESCGHVCMRKCHVTEDPDHENYKCMKPCAKTKKGCTAEGENLESHMCNKRCYEPCDDCNVEVTKKREACKHKELVPCSKSPDATPCRKKCARKLPCDHFCLKKCFEQCGDCNQKVIKKIPDCGHDIKVECKTEATRALCEKKCDRILVCGHRCRSLCKEPCDKKYCVEEMSMQFDSPCGHKVKLPCNVIATFINGGKDDITLLQHCRAACNTMLACGHVCSGDCARCLRGRLHVPCTQRCSQINICGHDCLEPCNQLCPPCRSSCEVRCAHSRCQRQCGAPCVPCQEACVRACPHRRCVRRCSEACSGAACARRCPLRLACGHACRGLCGERCPPVCNLCHPDTFPTDLLGDPFDDDAILVVLEDCGHIMELDDLENLMRSKSETVSLRACPTCRKPIINTQRYKDQVNLQFKTEINPIKERVYGSAKDIAVAKVNFTNKIKSFPETHVKIYKDLQFGDWRKALQRLYNYGNTMKKTSLLQLRMFFMYLDILEMLSEVYNKFKENNLTLLEHNLVEQNSMICRVLIKNAQKISQQQQMDISAEIKRMHSIVRLSKILQCPEYRSNQSLDKIIKAKSEAERKILGWGIYEEKSAVESLKALQNAVKVFGIVTDEERILIVQAIGAKAGSWYKCPNGHFYNIGECGGAMQVGRCIECKAQVGGQNHTLLSDNRHAGEMDNTRFAAWSDMANNMANFDLN